MQVVVNIDVDQDLKFIREENAKNVMGRLFTAMKKKITIQKELSAYQQKINEISELPTQ